MLLEGHPKHPDSTAAAPLPLTFPAPHKSNASPPPSLQNRTDRTDTTGQCQRCRFLPGVFSVIVRRFAANLPISRIPSKALGRKPDAASLQKASPRASFNSQRTMTLPAQFKTSRFTLRGESQAMLISSALVHASQWFSVLPLACDGWEVEVKIENHELVRSLCEALHLEYERGNPD